MEWLGSILAGLTVLGGGGWTLRSWQQRRRHREAVEQLARDRFRMLRRATNEDVTTFGEQLAALHVDTLADDLAPEARADYQRALDLYEQAKQALAGASGPVDLEQVTRRLEEGRFARACVLARRDGQPLPEHRGPCFFNPQHGPSAVDVAWTPPGGTERLVPVCRADERRLAGGEGPDTRVVLVGDRYVPWYAAGEAFDSYANGYYGGSLDEHRAATARLMTRTGTVPPSWQGQLGSGGGYAT